jgi:hypothetical protein
VAAFELAHAACRSWPLSRRTSARRPAGILQVDGGSHTSGSGSRSAGRRRPVAWTSRRCSPTCREQAAGGGPGSGGGPGYCASPRRQPASRLLVASAGPKGFRQHLASRPSHCDVCHQALGRQSHRATDNARAARQHCVARARSRHGMHDSWTLDGPTTPGPRPRSSPRGEPCGCAGSPWLRAHELPRVRDGATVRRGIAAQPSIEKVASGSPTGDR